MPANEDSSAIAEGATHPQLYALFWRWHFFAAMIVIPFVLWQATTGTLYLWSEWWMDNAHASLRFVQRNAETAPPSKQVAAALDYAGRSVTRAQMQPMVRGIVLSDDPRRSTTVLFQSKDDGLPYPIFIDPRTASVLGMLPASAWLPGITRALHGGWPLGDAGSWLLELGDCWAIVMILTGFYLWWPRGRRFPAFLILRTRNGTRVLLRDLHSLVAVLFSAVFLFFLISALPWTKFWGEVFLSKIEAMTGQSSPAGFSMGGASLTQTRSGLTALDEAVRQARLRNVKGTLDIRLSPETSSPWWMTNVHTMAPDHTIEASARTGAITGDTLDSQVPIVPRFVAFGVHVHQGDFGPINLWLNTAFAMSLVWLSVTGFLSWWIRRPKRGLGAPSKMRLAWPRSLLVSTLVMSAMLPIFGLSVLALATIDRLSSLRLFPRQTL